MKLKFASGGTFVPPYVVYQPMILPDNTDSTSSKSSKKSSKDSDEMGDITKLIDKMDGLPGDMIAVKERINQLANLIRSSEGMPGRATTITNAYTDLITLIKTVNSQKQYYNESKKHAQEKGSLNEVMFNDSGELRVLLEDGTLDWVSLQEYQENREEYRPITNGQLLDLRYNGQLGLAFDTDSVTAAADGVSMHSIQTKIKEGLANLEHNQVTRQGYVSQEQREVLKGIQTFKDVTKSGVGIDKVFKEEIISKDQASQIEYAFNYIYNGLTTKEKALLQYKALDIEGGVLGIMGQLIESKSGLQYKYEPVDDLTKGKGKESDGKAGLTEEAMSPIELLIAGYGNQDKIFIQTTKGKNMALEVETFSLPLMKGKSPLGANITLSDVMESTSTGGVDWKHATMGGADISSEAFDNIVVRGGSVYTGVLPVDLQGLQNQQVKPDFHILAKFKQLQTTLKEKNITNKEEINNMLREAGLPIMFDKDGFIISSNYRTFAMFNGTALGNAFNEDVSLEEWLSEIEDMNQIGNVLRIIQKKYGTDIDFDSKSWWDKNMPFWNKYTPVYKGVIFAPVEDSSISMRMGAGQDITPEQAQILYIMDKGRTKKPINEQIFVDAGNDM